MSTHVLRWAKNQNNKNWTYCQQECTGGNIVPEGFELSPLVYTFLKDMVVWHNPPLHHYTDSLHMALDSTQYYAAEI